MTESTPAACQTGDVEGRPSQAGADESASESALCIDRGSRRASLRGRTLSLGGRAFDLLAALAAEPGVVFSARSLMKRVWPRQLVADNNLRVQIALLRRHLGRDAVLNVPGRGYALNTACLQHPTPRAAQAQAAGACGAPRQPLGAAVCCPHPCASPASASVTAGDVRAIHRLLGECLDLWADPVAWQEHALAGLSMMIRLPVGLHAAVIDFQAGATPVVVSGLEHGWLEAAQRLHFREGHFVQAGPFNASPLDIAFRAVAQRGVHSVRFRAELLPDREWQRSEFNQQFNRPAGMDEMVFSAVRVGQPHRYDLLVFGGSGHRPRPRDRFMVSVVHRELARLARTRLAVAGEVSMAGLGPFDRMLLEGALTAASNDEIAYRLQSSPQRVQRGLRRLYEHFEVGDRLGLMAWFLRHRSTQGVRG